MTTTNNPGTPDDPTLVRWVYDEYGEITGINSGDLARVMRTCHGSSLSEEQTARLVELVQLEERAKRTTPQIEAELARLKLAVARREEQLVQLAELAELVGARLAELKASCGA